MTEKNPLYSQISDLENDIISFESGVEALGVAAQDAVDRNPESNLAALMFIEKGLRAVHDELRAKYDALQKAACGRAGS